MKRFYKTIAMIMVCMTLSTSVFASAGFESEASSVTLPSGLSAEASAEMLMQLYLLLESGMIVAGAKEGLDDAASAETLKDSFFTFMNSLSDAVIGSPPTWQDVTFVTSEGQTVTLDSESYNLYLDDGSTLEVTNDQFWDACLTGTITLDPDDTDTDTDEDTFIQNWNDLRDAYLKEKFEVYYEQWKQDNGGGSGDGQEPDDKDPIFSKLAKVTVGVGIVGAVGGFISDLLNGETALNPATYFAGADVMYPGYITPDENGNYHYEAYVYSGGSISYKLDKIWEHVSCGYYSGDVDANPRYLYFMPYDSDSDSFVTFTSEYHGWNGWNSMANNYYGITNTYISFYSSYSIMANFPIFNSKAEALAYCRSGDDSAATNVLQFDFPELVDSVPETLQPLTGVTFSPSSTANLNTALQTSADGYVDGGSTNVATNTEEYKNNLYAVIEKHSSENAIDSDDAESDTSADTGTGIIDYTSILTDIFNAIMNLANSIFEVFREPLEKFQETFDKIYNSILRIIEILPSQTERILGNIVTLPQAIFDLFTDPLAAIQNLLGLGNQHLVSLLEGVEPYLQDFKELLSDMVPEISLDVGGTTGGTGTDIEEGTTGGFKFKIILDGLILLILILIILLKIFLHCLEFIINVFKIPATTGFLPEDMVTGLEYLKSLEITGIGMSVFDFMMGLVYILLVFGVIRILRKNINYIRIER